MTSPVEGTATAWKPIVVDDTPSHSPTITPWTIVVGFGHPDLLEIQAQNAYLGDRAACAFCLTSFDNVGRNRLNRFYCDNCDAWVRGNPGQALLTLPALVVDVPDAPQIQRDQADKWPALARTFADEVSVTIQRNFGFVMNTGGATVLAVFPPGFVPRSIVEREPNQFDDATYAKLLEASGENAVTAARELTELSPKVFDGDRIPFSVGVHTDETVLFSVQGPTGDNRLADSGAIGSAAVDYPVAIDVAGRSIMIASELSKNAPLGHALVTQATDEVRHATTGDYVGQRTQVGPLQIRSISEADARPRRAKLSLAPPLQPNDDAGPARVDDVELHFGVSLDEEHVTCGIRIRSRDRLELGARAFHELLLFLARARLADAEAGVEAAEQGWRYQDDVAKDLGITPSLLNIHVFRARQQLAQLGIEDANALVERRAPTKQLRIGVSRLGVNRP